MWEFGIIDEPLCELRATNNLKFSSWLLGLSESPRSCFLKKAITMKRRIPELALVVICLFAIGCQKANQASKAETKTAQTDSSKADATHQEAVASQPTVTQQPTADAQPTAAAGQIPAAKTATEDASATTSLQPKTYVIAPSATVQFELQARLIEAVPGDTIQLEAGRYVLQRQLDVVADNITILGRGADQTVLTFKDQPTSGQGLEVTGNNFTLENLAIEDTAGNAVKVLGSRNVTFRGVRVEWTAAQPTSSNGAYGLYPVQCENVLMENCTAIGASDAGIYVGQCRNVIVRKCRAERNVAGIEIENTVGADVYENVATNNSGGLLVFDMPGLQLKQGGQVRCYQNKVFANNHPNFADPGAIVASVSPGTGVMVLATDNVEVFDNDIDQNQTASVLILSFTTVERKISDPTFDPYPEMVSIHDNRITNGGSKPSGVLSTNLQAVLGDHFPDILWDGTLKPGIEQPTLSLAGNGPVTFVNFDIQNLTPENIQAEKYKPSTDMAVFASALEPLKAIQLKPHDSPSTEGSRAAKVYRSLPKKLSEFGLFEQPLAKHQPVAGVVQYDLNTPLFSDYAEKKRFIRLPKGAQIQYRDQEVLDFPVGSLMAKTFSYFADMRDKTKGERLLETRIEFRNEDGWYGVTYVWNDEQTDATLVVGGGQVDVSWIHSDGQKRELNYSIPNANQCLNCHSDNKNYVPIGPTARNLNRKGPASEDSRKQLEQLAHAGMLNGLPTSAPIAAMPDFEDHHSGTTETRARAWMEVNCAHCHNPNGSARTTGLDLRAIQTELGKMGVWKNPVAAGHGSGGRKYDIVPGKPDESILIYRLESHEPSVMMPSVGRQLVHTEAVALLREWVQGIQDPKPN